MSTAPKDTLALRKEIAALKEVRDRQAAEIACLRSTLEDVAYDAAQAVGLGLTTKFPAPVVVRRRKVTVTTLGPTSMKDDPR